MLLRRFLLAVGLGVAAAALLGTAPARAGGLPWCGSGEPTTDLPDAVVADEWHVIYATPSNGADRFAAYAPFIAGDVGAITNWWLSQDPTRRPRFDLIDAPSCGTEFGRVDITFLRLPQTAGTESFDDVVHDLTAAGFTSPDKGYLVYLEDASDLASTGGTCGLGESGYADGKTDPPAAGYAVIYLDSCGQEYSEDLRRAVVAHEITHGMGAVQPQAPHYCSDGHVCDDPLDLMKPLLNWDDYLGKLTLDVGRDDYYGHSGSWWDVQDSLLLYRVDHPSPPAPALSRLTATSIGDSVDLSWSTPSPADWFNVYAPDGSLVDSPSAPAYDTTGTIGQILQFTVRSAQGDGSLGAPSTLRFKVGYGLVDANGTLVQDTVAPRSVGALKVTHSGKSVVVHWAAVSDPIGVRGYRVTVPGVLQKVVTTTSVKLPLARVRGKRIQVRTLDEAGNAAAPAVTTVRK